MATSTVRVGELRNAISTVVKMLANRGIEVTQSGLQAYVRYDERTLEPVRVNIPSISDTSSPELVTAIKGFVDHEVGHLLFSDAAIIARAHKEKIANLHNVVEDTYIERKMKEAFAGSTKNLDKTVEFAIKAFFQKTFDREVEDFRSGEGEQTQARFFVKALATPGIRALAGQEAAQEFMADKWALIPIVHELIEPLSDDLASVGSSLQALKVANTIRDLLCEAEEEEKRQKEEASEEDEGDEGESEGEGDGEGDEEQEGADKPSEDGETGDRNGDNIFDRDEEEPRPPEDDDGEGAEGGDVDHHKETSEKSGEGESESAEHKGKDKSPVGDAEGEGAEGEKSEGEGLEGNTEGDPGEALTGDGSDESASGPGGDDEVDGRSTGDERDLGSATSDTLDASGKHDGELHDHSALKEAIDDLTSYDEALSSAISEGALDSLVEGGYMPYSSEKDRIEMFDPGSHVKAMCKERQQKVRTKFAESIGVMSKSLERLMMARNRSMFVPGFRSGRLHSSNLYKLKTGDTRVFRRKEEVRTKNTAVLLLVDCSGSMGYRDRIVKASDAAYALCASLERVGIPTQVVGFTTDSIDFFDEAEREVSKIGSESGRKVGFDRVEALYMPIYKTFDERMTPAAEQRLAGIPFTDMRNNADGECVEIAANMLRTRTEERKILVVLSDGRPAMASVYSSGGYGAGRDRAECHLKDVVKDTEASGIETLGIGIETDSVTEYYPKNIVLDDVSELPTKIVSEMTAMLLR